MLVNTLERKSKSTPKSSISTGRAEKAVNWKKITQFLPFVLSFLLFSGLVGLSYSLNSLFMTEILVSAFIVLSLMLFRASLKKDFKHLKKESNTYK